MHSIKWALCQRFHAQYLWFKLVLGVAIAIFLSVSDVCGQTQFRNPEAFTEPWKIVDVASPESGVLSELSVREGDHIEKGEVIGKLDCHVLEATLKEAKQRLEARGKLNGAKAVLGNKSYLLKQMKALLDQQHASDKEVQQAQLDVDLAKASVEEAEDEISALRMNVKKIEAQLERRTVRAPFSGTVLELPRQKGEAITASESQVATIAMLNQLRVRYFLPTDAALTLKAGQIMTVQFPESGLAANAKVDFISPVTDSKSGTVRVELLINNNEGKYRSGIRCLLGSVRLAMKFDEQTQRK